MGKKNTKGTQRVTPIMNASIASPPYETAMGMSNTEEIQRGKRNKHVDLHSCKCVNKKTKNIPKHTRTWESITNLYGDADTTEVWDNQDLKPKAMFRSKLHQQENPQAIIDNSEKPTINLKNKPMKLSLFSLYRKRKKKDNKIKNELNEKSKDTDIHFLPYTEPKMQLKLKKPKRRFKDRDVTGDICMQGPCREALENLYKLQGLKYTPNINDIYEKEKVTKSENKGPKVKEKKKTKNDKIIKKPKNKQTEAIKTTKDRNVGYGDQISPIPLRNQDLMDVKCKCSFIGKMMKRTICKCNNNNKAHKHQISNNIDNQTGDPFLEIKVNSKDMSVINSTEVNEKIRKLGRLKKTKSCICPSNMKRLNNGTVCERGLCEKALRNKHARFHCKCQKHNVIECRDSTCDLQIQDIKTKSRKKKRSKSPRYKETNEPLFEVMLDPINMDIINSNEVQDIIKKTSQNKIICPTGICNTASKQKNVHLNCKCVGKKLHPLVNECGDKTCRTKKKCRLSYICSRVFSKSKNCTIDEENRERPSTRGNEYDTNFRRGDTIVRPHKHYKKNGVMINLPRQTRTGSYVGGRLTDAWCKCFCECAVKPQKKKTKNITNKTKKTKKITKKVPRRRKRRRVFFRKKKKDHKTISDKILDCLEKEEEECEKRVEKKTKEYKKNEKKAVKENRKIMKEQEEAFKANHANWNCLTNFVSGALNVSFETVKTTFKIIFSLIGDPVGSYVYVKEKSKDPPAAIKRVYDWFVRNWKNRSSVIAKRMQESPTMSVLADHFEDSALFHGLFAAKIQTPAEKNLYERRTKTRKRRMQKRHDEALYGCRHMTLMTLRKTPCLWFYQIWPDLYPQWLSLVAFMNTFIHVLIYLLAIICWTPCIITCEMFRACLCCFFCTH